VSKKGKTNNAREVTTFAGDAPNGTLAANPPAVPERGEFAHGSLASNRKRMARFLDRLGDTGNVRAACEAAGVPRRTAYNWRKRFATFAADWDEALENACDILEGEAWRRAITQDSDRLLMFLLKAHRREKYSDRVELQSDVQSVVRIVGGVDLSKVLLPPGAPPDD